MKEYKVNKADLSFYLIGALVFVVLGVLMVTGVIGPADESSELDRIGGIVIGWIAILFFGSLGLFSLSLFQGNDAIITMDEAGIFDRRVCIKPIPWSDINKVYVFRGKTLYTIPQRFISINVNNPDEYLKKHRNFFFSRILKKMKAMYDEPGITLSTAILGESIENVLDDIRKESNGTVQVEY